MEKDGCLEQQEAGAIPAMFNIFIKIFFFFVPNLKDGGYWLVNKKL